MAAPKTTKAPSSNEAVANYDWSQSGITGFENTTQQDLGIPFLSILQDGSPQVKKSHPNYAEKKIEGAQAGDVINSVANTILYKQGEDPLMFVPCTHEKLYVEWAPREKGGGMVKVHRNINILQECERNTKGQDQLKSGNIVVTTSYFYGLTLLDEPLPTIIGMSSTQLKKSRLWLNMMQALRLTNAKGEKFMPPMFSHKYAMTTVAEANNQGSWFGWQIRMGGPVTDKPTVEKALETAKSSFTGRASLPAPAEEHDPEKF